MSDWSLDQPPNHAVLSPRSIVFAIGPIPRVAHDADDHGRQFLADEDARPEDAAMSWQVWPHKVDWSKFLKFFPKPAPWAKPTRRQPEYDDVRWREPWDACYRAMARDLPIETRFALDGLARAMSLNPPPRPEGFRAIDWYTPHLDFDPEDFPGPGGDADLIPMMSPGNVVDLMGRLRSRSASRIAKDLRVAWDRLSGKDALAARDHVASIDAFLEDLGQWRAILEEVESAGAGYALDLS